MAVFIKTRYKVVWRVDDKIIDVSHAATVAQAVSMQSTSKQLRHYRLELTKNIYCVKTDESILIHPIELKTDPRALISHRTHYSEPWIYGAEQPSNPILIKNLKPKYQVMRQLELRINELDAEFQLKQNLYKKPIDGSALIDLIQWKSATIKY